MTIASNRQTGSNSDPDRTWVLVVAATGWVVLTTVVVLLATGTWSIGSVGQAPDRPARTQNPSTGQNGSPETDRKTPVPRQRTPQPTSPRGPSPRADREGLVYAGSARAMIPLQRDPRDR